MNTFLSIRIKKDILEKFKVFSKSVAPNHSKAMHFMILFFTKNGISPQEDFGPHFKRLEKNILKSINTIIGMLKIIEKEQLKPTLGILTVLLEEVSKAKKPMLVEKLILAKPIPVSNSQKIYELKNENKKLKLKIIKNEKILESLKV